MAVAVECEGLDLVAVADEEGGFGEDLSDAGKAEVGEGLFPGVEQGDGVARGDGEEEFEILAVGEGGDEWWFGGGGAEGGVSGGAADGDGAFE